MVALLSLLNLLLLLFLDNLLRDGISNLGVGSLPGREISGSIDSRDLFRFGYIG